MTFWFGFFVGFVSAFLFLSAVIALAIYFEWMEEKEVD